VTKKLSILTLGVAAAVSIAAAHAEDFTAGKTPAQLFRSDCSGCHAQPAGILKRRRDIAELAEFLREHYTTKSESAQALATYLAGFMPADHAAGRGHRRNHGERKDDSAASETGDSKAAADTPHHPKHKRTRHNGDASDGEPAAPAPAPAPADAAPAGAHEDDDGAK
jgi:hypothetical protein